MRALKFLYSQEFVPSRYKSYCAVNVDEVRGFRAVKVQQDTGSYWNVWVELREKREVMPVREGFNSFEEADSYIWELVRDINGLREI